MRKAISLIALSALMSCGPAPEIKRREPLFKTTENLVVLSPKADREVILDKYKNKISLVCSFRIDNRPGYDISSFSFMSFTANLAAGEAPQELSFKMNNGQSFTVGMRIKGFDILPEVVIPGYAMKNSPVVKLLIRGRELPSGKVYERVIDLYEKVEVPMKDLFPKKYPQDLICKLHTEIPEDYLSEWTAIETAVSPAEVETVQSPVL